ncbi:MAG: lysophospholipid acyltransferase family protein [Anaerolineales bacterium]|nr:lysophospholipid acyltransferase family protein [Anaerolineales bacterium]
MGDQLGSNYDHEALERQRWILRWMIEEIGFRFLLKFDHVEGVENFPQTGPVIVIINHIAFVDPVVVLATLPRNVVPMAKVEAYSYPIWGIFPRLWEVIPVRRQAVDRRALRHAMNVLRAGESILIAPEGTRSPQLQEGKEGVAFLGSRAGAAIVPAAIEGTEGFPSINPRRWKQSGAVVKIGKPFRFLQTGRVPGRGALRKMTDEAMYVLAGMLPPERRGVYSDLESATRETIEFI